MPRFLYGSSADAIASQEMGRDSARDSRFFQSIQQQRAAQAQLDQELYRQASFQAQQQQQARQEAQYAAQQRRLYGKQQQDLELGYERVAAQRDLGLEKNRFLEAKMMQDRDLAEGRMDLMSERNQFMAERTNPADVRLQLAQEKAEAEQKADQEDAQRYQALQRERALLRRAQNRMDSLPEEREAFLKGTTRRYNPFGTSRSDAENQFDAAAEATLLRKFYPEGSTIPKSLTFAEKLARAKAGIPQRLTDIEDAMIDIPQYLRRSSSAAALPVASPPPLQRPPTTEIPLGGGGGGPIAPARVIADAQAAIAQGRDPALVVRRAQEKYGVDLTPYLR